MPIPVSFTSAMPEIAVHLKETVNPDFILSPDKGAIDRAMVAESIGLPYSYLEKTRIDAHTIVHKAKNLDVDGKIVAIVDDMIATGGTICKAADALRSQGAIEVHAACTHGLFTGGAIAIDCLITLTECMLHQAYYQNESSHFWRCCTR